MTNSCASCASVCRKTDWSRCRAERLVDSRRRHLQLPGDAPEANPFGLELPDFTGAAIDGGRATKLHTTLTSSSQPGVDALLDDPALKLRHSHQDAQLEPPSRVVVAGVDALAAGDERYPEPVQFVEDQGQVGETPAQPVELVNDQTLNLASPDTLHQLVQFWPRRLGPGNPVGVERQVAPAALAAVAFQLLLLAVGALVVGADPDIDGSVHETTVYRTPLKYTQIFNKPEVGERGGFVNRDRTADQG